MANIKENKSTKLKKFNPNELTKRTIERIVRAMRTGADVSTAAAFVGVRNSQLNKWLREGRRKTHGLEHDLVIAIEQAHSEVMVKDLTCIDRAARDQPAQFLMKPVVDNQGQLVIDPLNSEVLYEPAKDPKGNFVLTLPARRADWKAAAWRIERKYDQWKLAATPPETKDAVVVNLVIPDNGRSIDSKIKEVISIEDNS